MKWDYLYGLTTLSFSKNDKKRTRFLMSSFLFDRPSSQLDADRLQLTVLSEVVVENRPLRKDRGGVELFSRVDGFEAPRNVPLRRHMAWRDGNSGNCRFLAIRFRKK